MPLFRPGWWGRVRYLHSHHDRFFVHKALGIAALAHFAYRVPYMFVYGFGRSGFAVGGSYTLAAILLHTALALSALIFSPPVKRMKGQPMIYREYQLHSVIFSLRSLGVMLCWHLDARRLGGACILLAHLAADLVTHRYQQGTTMRDMPYPPGVSDAFRRRLNLLYSYAQIMAVCSLFFFGFEGGFLVLFPIQFAAFLLTMVRKAIIDAAAWHVLYTLSLLLDVFYGLVCLPAPSLVQVFAIGTACALLRFRFRVNKYLLWAPLWAYTALGCDDSHRACAGRLGLGLGPGGAGALLDTMEGLAAGLPAGALWPGLGAVPVALGA